MSEGIAIAIIAGVFGIIAAIIGVVFKKKGTDKTDNSHHNQNVSGDNNTTTMNNK
jgi:biopolymer transport protein ExbB/TolQ